MNQQITEGLEKVRAMNPQLECECLRALSIVNMGIATLYETKEIRDLLEEGAVYAVLRAHLGQKNIGSDMMRDQMPESLFKVD
jgi:hypothetical protein